MKKLNMIGEELIEYKIELGKDYSHLVMHSLKLGIEQMLKNNSINQEVYLSLLDNEMKVETFKAFLLAKPEFQKSDKELIEDYDIVANDILYKLKNYEIYDILKASNPAEESIHFTQTFILDKDFARNYFDVEEVDLDRIFQRKGFFEKFAVLRLNKILTDWLLVEELKENLLKVELTKVYYGKESYNIDIEYVVPFELCENKSMRDDVILEIVRLYENSKHHFETMI